VLFIFKPERVDLQRDSEYKKNTENILIHQDTDAYKKYIAKNKNKQLVLSVCGALYVLRKEGGDSSRYVKDSPR
jgi:hypothetical protein